VHHVIVTRFSVPRPLDPVNAVRHEDSGWLNRRLDLFRSYFLPSVERLRVPVIVLCSTSSSSFVSSRIEDIDCAEVVVQDEWHGGWTGPPDCTVTRMDSDDAIHSDWLRDIDEVETDAPVLCTKRFLRLDIETGRLRAYKRKNPAPLAAFRHGRNPYQYDHEELERRFQTCTLDKPYLLQIYHGENVSSRRPKLLRRRASHTRLASYGIE
jgi:hypothetical protein